MTDGTAQPISCCMSHIENIWVVMRPIMATIESANPLKISPALRVPVAMPVNRSLNEPDSESTTMLTRFRLVSSCLW